MSTENLDLWTYYSENRPKRFMDFLDKLNVKLGPNEHRDPVAKIIVDPQKFIDYALTHKDTCQEKWFHPRDFLSSGTNIEMALPLETGRHKGNSSEFNWGLYENTNEEVKSLIGHDMLERAGYIPETVLARLIIYLPGHGIPWHRDTLDSWSSKFAHLNPNWKTNMSDLGEIQRRLIMVTDWHWGHMLQLNNAVLSHWSSGDVYNIPLGEWHLSTNQGIMPKITIAMSGVVKA